MHERSQFQQNLLDLESQVKRFAQISAQVSAQSAQNPEPATSTTATTARDSLESLRVNLVTGNNPSVSSAKAHGDELASLPAGVPNLSEGMKPSSEMVELKKLLISVSPGEDTKLEVSSKKAGTVGAYGMGGIGKTVLAAWIARDRAVRTHFDRILWLTSSQTPNLPKLQAVLYLQTTGSVLLGDKSTDEVAEMLSLALRGKRVLLILDGECLPPSCFVCGTIPASLALVKIIAYFPSCEISHSAEFAVDVWDSSHEVALNHVDVAAQSRILVTTRIKGLLAGAAQVELGLPSKPEALGILLTAAGLEHLAAQPPVEAAEVVDVCGRLPLTLAIAGKLIAECGLGAGDSWEGVAQQLKEQLAGFIVILYNQIAFTWWNPPTHLSHLSYA